MAEQPKVNWLPWAAGIVGVLFVISLFGMGYEISAKNLALAEAEHIATDLKAVDDKLVVNTAALNKAVADFDAKIKEADKLTSDLGVAKKEIDALKEELSVVDESENIYSFDSSTHSTIDRYKSETFSAFKKYIGTHYKAALGYDVADYKYYEFDLLLGSWDEADYTRDGDIFTVEIDGKLFKHNTETGTVTEENLSFEAEYNIDSDKLTVETGWVAVV